MSDIILHGMWRSSASYRVRIALNLKGLPYQQKNYVLANKEHKTAEFLSKNPQGLIPALEVDGKVITQSLTIIEYLDHIKAENRLLPLDVDERARVQSIAYSIACEIHPLNNLRVLQYLKNDMAQDQDSINKWYRHWVAEEFTALEKKLSADPATGKYCHGDKPGFADCFLIPQIYNAQRFDCDLSGYPTLMRINKACLELKAFREALPENQPDAI
ncbi:MAG TPA: maleylacetoacetate isomerase [Emcibacteraceae bacterium]|nr:maleylacetoacetate isomerase [Emcibacteraceae bacterium]HRW30600.1 maleylacetoacetate isomerase [Emcibacteraceae bacterium]